MEVSALVTTSLGWQKSMKQLRSAPEYGVKEDPGSRPRALADWVKNKNGSVCKQVS